MASRLDQIVASMVSGLFGKAEKPESLTPALPVQAKTPQGTALVGEALEQALKTVAPGSPAIEALTLSLTANQSLGPVSTAIFKGIAAAVPGLLLLPSAAQIMGEVPFIRPLRKAFSPAMLSGIEIIDAHRKGAYEKDHALTLLRESGLSEEDAAALFKITEFYATPSDIIRFAVRDIYTPAIREKFRLDDGFTEVAAKASSDLFKAGVSEDTLRQYWAAHWELPSASMGFDMLHRGIIDEDTLKLLLRALDYNPFWQDKLIQLAYSPLTRVDIRRMFKLGVLDETAMHKAHLALGYNEENANLLDQFVIKSITDPEANEETLSDREATKQRDLTVSQLLDGLEEGILTSDLASKALRGLGYTEKEASFLVNQRLTQSRTAAAKDVVKSLRAGYVGGIYDDARVSQELAAAGFPSDEIAERIRTWKLELESRVVMPTRTDVLRWYKNRLITEAQARNQLERQGVPDTFIAIYLEENAPKQEAQS